MKSENAGNNQPPEGIVAKVMNDLIETMFFCSPEYRGSGEVQGPVIAATVGFAGEVSGEIWLGVETSLIRQFAADFLGVEESDIPEEQLPATVDELTNVTCCSIMAAWRPGKNFRFTIPRELTDSESLRNVQHRFIVEGGGPRIGLEVRLSV